METIQAIEITLLSLVISHAAMHSRSDLQDAWKQAKAWLKLETTKVCKLHERFALAGIMLLLGFLAAAPVLFYGFELIVCIFVHD